MNLERILDQLGVKGVKRSGKELLALCPNPGHDDRSPSWHIRDEPGSKKHGLFLCWSCSYSGNLPKLVADLKGIRFREAEEWLAKEAPPEVPHAVKMELKNSKRRGFELPPGADILPLEKWVTPARDYARKRGIEEGQVERWGIGFSATGKLAGRIIFSKRTRDGILAGYSARSFVGEEPRYLEAKVTEGADPDVLFGEEHWGQGSECVVTEGAINALAVERAFPDISLAAMSGSNPRPIVFAKLARFKKIVLVTDPDAAGERAANELMGSLGRHAEVMRAKLPDNRDAAELSLLELREVIEPCLA